MQVNDDHATAIAIAIKVGTFGAGFQSRVNLSVFGVESLSAAFKQTSVNWKNS